MWGRVKMVRNCGIVMVVYRHWYMSVLTIESCARRVRRGKRRYSGRRLMARLFLRGALGLRGNDWVRWEWRWVVSRIGNLGWERIRKHRVEEKTWRAKGKKKKRVGF